MSESIEMLEAKFSNWCSENDVCDDGSWAHGAQSGFNFALEFIRQQEAELATLRDQIKRAEEQEPVAWALWWPDHPSYFCDEYISTYRGAVEEELLPTVVGNPEVVGLVFKEPK